MVKYKYLIIVSLILSVCACSKIVGEDELILLERIENTSEALRLDGYYVRMIGDNNPTMIVYFFYRNGIVLSGGGATLSELEELEERYRNGEFYTNVKNSKIFWGVYQLNADEIRFERWYPSDRPYGSSLRIGKIQNDSTFIITSTADSDGSDVRFVNELFKFKEFSPKPDSTNIFID